MTKLVLFPVRFMFTAATGRVGTNEEAVGWYLAAADGPAKSLVRDAFAWRAAAPEDRSAAAALLREQLVPVYLRYIDDHIDRRGAIGDEQLSWLERRDLSFADDAQPALRYGPRRAHSRSRGSLRGRTPSRKGSAG